MKATCETCRWLHEPPNKNSGGGSCLNPINDRICTIPTERHGKFYGVRQARHVFAEDTCREHQPRSKDDE